VECSDWWCLAEDESLWRTLLFSDSRWPGLGPDSPQVAKNQRRCKTLKQLFRFKHLGWQNQQRVLLALSPGANDYKLGYRYVIHQVRFIFFMFLYLLYYYIIIFYYSLLLLFIMCGILLT
jgi:hypothetical protein